MPLPAAAATRTPLERGRGFRPATGSRGAPTRPGPRLRPRRARPGAVRSGSALPAAAAPTAEIGYWVAPGARGHGYAAEASAPLAEWGFEHRHAAGRAGLRRAATWPRCATALGAGFRFEGSPAAYQGGGTDGVPAQRGDDAMFARLPADPGAPVPPAFPPLPPGGLSDGVIAAAAVTTADDAAGTRRGATRCRCSGASAVTPPSADRVPRLRRAGRPGLAGRPWRRMTIVDVATGRFAGSIQLQLCGPPQVGGIGYGVHPAFRGRGYTTRALRLLAPWAFEHARLRPARARRQGRQRRLAASGAGRPASSPTACAERRLRNADGTSATRRGSAVNPRYRLTAGRPTPGVSRAGSGRSRRRGGGTRRTGPAGLDVLNR